MKVEVEISKKAIAMTKAYLTAMADDDDDLEQIEKFFKENEDKTVSLSADKLKGEEGLQLMSALIMMAGVETMTEV